MNIIDLFKLPEAQSIQDIDDPQTHFIHKQIIQQKHFLKKIYINWYKEFEKTAKTVPKGHLVELGSGGGFLKEILPEVITSDLVLDPDINLTFSVTKMPFDDNSVSAMFLLNVLHHVKDPVAFFLEANRCLVNHGKLLMIEPYVSLWGEFIWKNFHHEPCEITSDWEIKNKGRLTGANSALPWIIFVRDRHIFEQEFPSLKITKVMPHTPFLYLISGGLSFRQLAPSCSYSLFKMIENFFSPLNSYLGMFVTIELEKMIVI